ncbi:MAG: MltA domain-containing protein [Thermodesulfobacteriota bacterium]
MASFLLPGQIWAGSMARLAAVDDGDRRSLSQAVARTNAYYKARPAAEILTACGETFTVAQMRAAFSSLAQFLAREEGDGLASYIEEHFEPCPPVQVMVTGYYEPVLAGRLRPDSTFRYALYSPPAGPARRAGRRELETSTMLAGRELVYLADEFARFLVHVQGSALVELADGKRRRLHYAADNGHPYTSVGKVLVGQGKLTRSNADLAGIREFFTAHPEQLTDTLQRNQRFIFFSLSDPLAAEDGAGPPGALGQSLVPGRSVALDHGHYGAGGLLLFQGRVPQLDGAQRLSWRPVTRLLVNHDQGGAIKGPRRLDLFMGQGAGAARLAGVMREGGQVTYLRPKKDKN